MKSALPRRDSRTIILAAGRGRRLADGANQRPKVLLEFGGKTLLQRHLELLERVGAGPVSVVVGYRRAEIEVELERIGRTDTVSLIDNPDWQDGSAVSLDRAGAVLYSGAPVLLMDADVIYDHRLLDRLVQSAHDNALLLDREIEPGDEPVKICVSGARRIVDFAKIPEIAGDWHGESVGFFRFEPATAARLAKEVRAVVESGARATEYEEPIRALIRADETGNSFGFEDVTGLPWTEIDFMEDVEKAQALLPSLAA
jgi:choline kinase